MRFHIERDVRDVYVWSRRGKGEKEVVCAVENVEMRFHIERGVRDVYVWSRRGKGEKEVVCTNLECEKNGIFTFTHHHISTFY